MPQSPKRYCFDKSSLKRPLAVSLVLGSLVIGKSSFAEPLPLPYRSQPPFIPVFDLNGPAEKGLIISAEEVLAGRPVAITIGNATFIPAVRRAGERYGGYTRIRGDLDISRGDIYLKGQPVGAGLEQLQSEISAHQSQLSFQSDLLGEQAGQLDRLSIDLDQAVLDLGKQDQRILKNLNQITGLESTAQQQQESIGLLNQSVQTLGQTSLQHAAILTQHDQAIDALAVDLISTKQSLRQIGENLADLGSGMAGATALASALSSVPNTSDDTRVACGLGSGTYSNRYALAVGCALRLSSAISLNGAGSYLFNGGVDYGAGTLSDIAGRFGFVYRFGGLHKGFSSRKQIESLQSQLDDSKKLNRQIFERLEAVNQRLRLLESLAQTN